MTKTLKSLFANFALMGGTLLVMFAIFEYGVFKYILPADDVLPSVSINKVVRYAPNTKAVFYRPDGSTDLVTINADGWNSTKPDYVEAKPDGKTRVAVIGDSYVHSAYVDVDKGFPEIMEKRLKAKGIDAEVMRFGADGAPLSQYLNVLRNEVLKFSPDVVVVQLIHNDFDESYRFLNTRYASSFMKVGQKEDGDFFEIPAQDFKPGLADTLRSYRSFRYLYYQTGLYLQIQHYVKRYWWGEEVEGPSKEFISSAVDIRNIRDHDKNRKFGRYVFQQMQALATKHNFKLAFAMDGVREAVYANKPASDYEVGALNKLAGEELNALSLPFVDLHNAFKNHYQKHKKRFEFSYDWHWNELGNEVVADSIVDLLTTHPKLFEHKSVLSSL